MEQLLNAYREAFQVFSPPPSLTVSEWADRYRQLSSVSSAEPGQWRTSRAPWTKGIMDAFNDPDIEGVIVKSSAQIGKTEIINNVVGYFIHQDASPIMVLQPTRDDAEDWSKDRLMRGMIDCSPCFHGLIQEVRVKGSGNTIVHKEFPGGQLTVAWSNSESRLASRPIRILLMDEINKYDINPGPQGDPIARARSRTKNFWNRRWGVFSTPTLTEVCAVSRLYDESDRRKFFVPCPHCEHKFVIDFFKNIMWDKDPENLHPKFGAHHPETAYCVCLECGGVIPENLKDEMVAKGEWIAERPHGGNVAGFHISELYSSLGGSSWAKIATKFLEAGKNVSLLQNFNNETLGLSWDIQGDTVDNSILFARREDYPVPADWKPSETEPIPPLICPMGVAVLTASVDVQGDRLEVLVKGWGPGEESWDIFYQPLLGDPAKKQIWSDLDQLLAQKFDHEIGVRLEIICTLIDSGGHHTQEVYNYCRSRWNRHIFACKGRANSPGEKLPIVGRPTELSGLKLYGLGVDTAKQQIYRRLKLAEPGSGFYHFPIHPKWDEEYFLQLTGEKETVKYKNFRPMLQWIKLRDRNEALDLNVYSLAALKVRNVNLSSAHQSLLKRMESIKADAAPQPQIAGAPYSTSNPTKPKAGAQRRFTNSFVNKW